MKSGNRLETIRNILIDMNAPPYREKQVREGIFCSDLSTYSSMTFLPVDLRTRLVDSLGDDVVGLRKIAGTSDDQVTKVLFSTHDGNNIEAVLTEFKRNKHRRDDHISLCISSQSGCAMGCKFCATGAMGFKKDLTADEIVDQVLYFIKTGRKIDSVAFMGMGEPLVNPHIYDALRIMTDRDNLGLSQRRISVSTVGIIPGIKRLQKEFPSINLGLSLHSPFPDQRFGLMPITKVYPIADVMLALKGYVEETNKRVLLAYVLLAGVNDSIDHAEALTKLIKKQGAKSYLFEVKLIRFNPCKTKDNFSPASDAKIHAFQKVLDDFGIKNTLRQNFGVGISAACGQLAG